MQPEYKYHIIRSLDNLWLIVQLHKPTRVFPCSRYFLTEVSFRKKYYAHCTTSLAQLGLQPSALTIRIEYFNLLNCLKFRPLNHRHFIQGIKKPKVHMHGLSDKLMRWQLIFLVHPICIEGLCHQPNWGANPRHLNNEGTFHILRHFRPSSHRATNLCEFMCRFVVCLKSVDCVTKLLLSRRISETATSSSLKLHSNIDQCPRMCSGHLLLIQITILYLKPILRSSITISLSICLLKWYISSYYT